MIAERTAGEVSARCHDEEANRLALNLMHDIVSGDKSVGEAREYSAKEFLDYRRKEPTPYMDELRFTPGDATADPDEPFRLIMARGARPASRNASDRARSANGRPR